MRVMHEEEPTKPIDEELEEDVEGNMSSSRMRTASRSEVSQ